MNQIRLATVSDINLIMDFINTSWKENHILARDKDFFIYEHQEDNCINYVISLENNTINGVLGFIKYSDINSDIATVIWKALKSNDHPMLGIEIFNYLREHPDYNMLFSLGINAKTIGIYNYLDVYTNYLDQFIMINRNYKNFNILKLEESIVLKDIKFTNNDRYKLVKLEKNQVDFDFEKKEFIPHKDKSYFIKRYFDHPIYTYNVYGVYLDKEMISLIVTREVEVNNSKILRIMDFLGNENSLEYVSKNLYEIVVKNNYEYIDFMCFGFEKDILNRAGFDKIDIESKAIIAPNYFAPFVQENIKINFMADTKEIERLRICKADGDQDRPN